ncbi:hypothetical protein [Streptococcus sp. 9903]|uniref:hypothetical protein n=1 Tax=Streptococcus sp. 9903 TaxID=2582677 RepID=UPI000AAFDA7A|nr:hypothetical protein [Streptococcus sp. 9903]
MNNTQVYQAQTTNHGIARALGKEMNFKEFKTWLDEAVSMAEAMALPENKAVLDDLIENTANNLVFIAELVESRQLIYRKPRHED